MTALQEYQRLECTGLWRDGPEGQRREVIVSFGDATLVIAEARSGRAITHWSLPAVVRLAGHTAQARYAPAPDADEELEIDDRAMIDAIAKVHRLIAARRPHPGRLRSLLLGTGLVALLAVLVLWMPGQLYRHTAASLPVAKRQEIGRAALADLSRLTGAPCAAAEGQEALARLHARLLGPEGEIYVVPEGVNGALALPGGLVVLGRGLVEAVDLPEVAAGAVLAADLDAAAADPLVPLLRHAGLGATFRLLTTGEMPAAAVAGFAEVLLTRPAATLPAAALLDRFGAARVAAAPFASWRDPSGESLLALIEADPGRALPAAEPVLTDADWVALQGICGG